MLCLDLGSPLCPKPELGSADGCRPGLDPRLPKKTREVGWCLDALAIGLSLFWMVLSWWQDSSFPAGRDHPMTLSVDVAVAVAVAVAIVNVIVIDWIQTSWRKLLVLEFNWKQKDDSNLWITSTITNENTTTHIHENDNGKCTHIKMSYTTLCCVLHQQETSKEWRMQYNTSI